MLQKYLLTQSADRIQINSNRMEPQLNQSRIILKLTERIGDFPATLTQIQQAIRSGRKNDPLLGSLEQENILRMMISSNNKMIECQFLDMMQQVLKKIQPEIKHYPEHQSIKYLESIIYEHLDPKIFSTVRISKIRTKLLGNTFQSKNMTTTDKLFTQLITVMNELLQIMKQYYGFTRDGQFPGILFECISRFISENHNCFLVEQDRKSQSEIQEGNKKDVLIQAINQIQAEQKEKNEKTSTKAIKIAENLVLSLYSQLKQVNPFSKKLDEKQIEEKKEILKKVQNGKRRERLNENTIKIVQRLLSMSLTSIIETMDKQEKIKFSGVLYDSLEQFQKLKSNQKKIGKIKEIESEILAMLETAADCDGSMADQEFREHQQLKWITLLFKAIEKQYHNDSERRKWLIKFCENQQISKKLDNPYSVIKILESQRMQENSIIKSLRSLPISIKLGQNKRESISKKQVEAHLALEHQLNRIRLYQLKKKYQKEPQVEFEKLTNSKTRVITFLFSGFLSEDTCKIQQWSGLLSNFYDSQVYSVRWQSKTVTNMMEFAFKTVTEFGPSQSIAMLGGPYIKAIAIIHHLYKRFQQNPFNPAFESAKMTGEFMGEFIAHNFKVGFSLGTEVIKNIMTKLAQKNSLNILHKVYLMGGVADLTQVQNLIEHSPSPLTIINLHSDNDYILKYLLRLCKYEIKPVGLNPIKQFEGHTVKNEDCTYYVEGHMAYRTNLQFFSKWLKIADD